MDQSVDQFFFSTKIKEKQCWAPKDYFLNFYDRKTTFFGCITIKENEIHFF